jgi:predicted AAA+ superfamily ATPase
MNKETLKYLITEFHEKALPAVLSRTMQLPVDSGKIIALTGIRRSGKTFLMYQTIHQLLQKGVPKENILYLNFEDDRLFPIQLQEMDLILKAIHE